MTNNFLKHHAKICAYCNKSLLCGEKKTIDHISPKSKGGSERIKNKVVCCEACNQKKANMKLKEFKKIVNKENLLNYLKHFGNMQAPTGEHYALVIRKKFRLNVQTTEK